MNVMVPLPDQFAARFGAGAERERRVLEVLALDEYRTGRMSKAELGEVLGLGSTPGEVDHFLWASGLKAVAAPVPRTGPSLTPQVDRQMAEGGQQDRETAAEVVERFKAFRAGKTLSGLAIKDLIAEGRR